MQFLMHYGDSQNMVRYQSSDLNVADILVAEFRESIMHAIPQMLIFLRSHDLREKRMKHLNPFGMISIF
jgi:hypothetical protein